MDRIRIVLKSGYSFEITSDLVALVEKFVHAAPTPGVKFFAEKRFFLRFDEVAAIHPAEWPIQTAKVSP